MKPLRAKLRRFPAAIVIAAIGLCAAPARADGTDPVTADALCRAGRDAMTHGDFPAACARFQESLRLEAAVGTLMNLADCEERRGALAVALQKWREAEDQLVATTDDRLRIARNHVQLLEKRVPRLKIHLDGAPTARVLRDGVEIGRAALDVPLPVNPGEHLLVVEAPGRAIAKRTVVLAEGQVLDVVVAPGPAPAAARAEPAPEPAAGGSTLRTAGLVALAVGGAGIVVGAITSGLIVHDRSVVDDHCPNNGCNSDGLSARDAGKSLLAPNLIAWIVGVVGIGGGVGLLLAAPKPGGAAMTIAPRATANGASLGLAGSF